MLTWAFPWRSRGHHRQMWAFTENRRVPCGSVRLLHRVCLTSRYHWTFCPNSFLFVTTSHWSRSVDSSYGDLGETLIQDPNTPNSPELSAANRIPSASSIHFGIVTPN